MTSPLDAPLFSCPRCGVDLVWQAVNARHVAECSSCGWFRDEPKPETMRSLLGASLARYPALRDQVLGAMEGALLKAEEKRYQKAEAERLRARDWEQAKTHPCIIPGCVDQPAIGDGRPCLPHAREGLRRGIGPARGERRAWTRDEAAALARVFEQRS